MKEYHSPRSGFGQLRKDSSVWEWAPMSIGKNQIIGWFVATKLNFLWIFYFMQYLIFYVIKKGPHNFWRIYIGQWNNNCQSVKNFLNYLSKWLFCQRHITRESETPVPVVNNPICSKMPWPNMGWFLRVPGRGLTTLIFMVRIPWDIGDWL